MRQMKFNLGLIVAVACICSTSIAAEKKPAGEGFVSIFDGKTLDGWHVSGKTRHGTGGRWVVEEGAIVGSQDRPGSGGIIITDKKYGNFEVIVEMRNDYGPDSGLFLRSTDRGQAYQCMIDYHADGNVMGVHGEEMSGDIYVVNFNFGEKPSQISQTTCPFPLPISADKWPEF